MVSQTSNEEWEASQARNSTTLTVDCRQPQQVDPPGIRTPPSYFDAVRSRRHSLSQPDNNVEKPILNPQQVKYNSLPRPLPQRLQVCPNGTDVSVAHDPSRPPCNVPNDRGRNAVVPPQDRNNDPIESPRSGFQIYTRPPGPANHVPLNPASQFLDKSSSASLPRCFPRTNTLMPPPPPTRQPSTNHHQPPPPSRDVQQPLSVIVQQQPNDYPKRTQQVNGFHQPTSSHRRMMPAPDHVQYYTQGNGSIPPIHGSHSEQLPIHRSPYANMNLPKERTNSLQRNMRMNPELRQFPDGSHRPSPPRNPSYQDSFRQREAFQYCDGSKQDYGGPIYNNFQHLPRQQNAAPEPPEPVVSMRMGKLGTYPETPSHRQPPTKTNPSNNLLKCADTEGGIKQYPISQQERIYRNGQKSERNARQDYHHESMQSPAKNYGQDSRMNSYPNSTDSDPYNYSSYQYSQKYNQGPENKNYRLPMSSLPPPAPPSRRSNENGGQVPAKLPPPDSGFPPNYSNYNNAQYHPRQNSSTLTNGQKYYPASEPVQNFSSKNSDEDYFRSSPHKNMCETPEEAGLVMIVESLDVNGQLKSTSKDLVKPKPRIPMSPTHTLPRVPQNPHESLSSFKHPPEGPELNGSVDKFGRIQYAAPLSRSASSSFSYPATQNGSLQHSNNWNNPPQGDRAFSQSNTSINSSSNTSQPLRSLNLPLLRRTPLSSSTASLSSEISSVSSKQWKPQTNGLNMRFPGSVKVMHGHTMNGKDKAKEISPSPWTREEKEEKQKQQILGARQVRDKEISYLESLSDRSDKQEEWLRILRLEQEFQRRAEEIGDEDEEEEEDEVLLERAEHRERMLLMEKELALSESDKSNKFRRTNKRNLTSSSDQWLVTSQAKHSPKNTSSDGSLLNTSFEVEQFNDLLETMNMSPVIRDTGSQDEPSKKDTTPTSCTSRNSSNSMNGCNDDVFVPVNTNQLEKGSLTSSSASSRLNKPSSTSTQKDYHKNAYISPADFCFPIESAQTYGKMNKSSPSPTSTIPCGLNQMNGHGSAKSDSLQFINKAKSFSDEVSSGSNGSSSKPEQKQVDNDAILQSKVEDKNQSKYAARVLLSVATKDKENEKKNGVSRRDFFRSSSVGSSGYSSENSLKPTTPTTGKTSLRDKNTYYANSIQLSDPNKKKRPTSDSSINSFLNQSLGKTQSSYLKDSGSSPTDVPDSTSPEYNKIWTSRPEKLTFLDKIKKFSQQAGEDNVPRDKVKNSRAQRELEIKFNGDGIKSIEQRA